MYVSVETEERNKERGKKSFAVKNRFQLNLLITSVTGSDRTTTIICWCSSFVQPVRFGKQLLFPLLPSLSPVVYKGWRTLAQTQGAVKIQTSSSLPPTEPRIVVRRISQSHRIANLDENFLFSLFLSFFKRRGSVRFRRR